VLPKPVWCTINERNNFQKILTVSRYFSVTLSFRVALISCVICMSLVGLNTPVWAHGNEAHEAATLPLPVESDEGEDIQAAEIVYQPQPQVMSPQLGGSWSPVYDWPIVAIHAALLPNGKVLAWDAAPDDYLEDPHTSGRVTTRVTLWDPIDNTHLATNNDTETDLFCAGSAHR